MYSVSSNFLAAVRSSGRSFRYSLTVKRTGYSDLTYDQDAIISIKRTASSLSGSDSFEIGSVISSQLDVSLKNLDGSLTGIKFKGATVVPSVSVKLSDGSYESCPLGIYTVNESKAPDGAVNLNCYDGIINLEGLYQSDLTYPVTLLQIAQEIASKGGLTLASTDFPNASVSVVTKPDLAGTTLRQALGWVAEAACSFARMNRAGLLEFAWYSATPTGDDIDRDNSSALTLNEVVPEAYDGVRILQSSDDASPVTSGTCSNPYDVVANPLLVSNQSNFIAVIYNRLNGFSYMPYDATWLGNPALDTGDKLTVTGRDGTAHSSYVTSDTQNYTGGLQSTTAAEGTTEKIAEATGDLTSQVNKVTEDQEEIQNLVTQNFSAVNASIENLNVEKLSVNDAAIEYAKITDLDVTNENVTNLNAQSATVINLLSNNAGIDSLSSSSIKAAYAALATATLGDAQIANLSVSKILAGDISTTKFRLVSDSGNLVLSDNTIQISDSTRARVQIGKDASGDYNMYVWDASGNLMFDAAGLHAAGIKSGIIRDDMVASDASINGSKIDQESLVSRVNGATTLLLSSRIQYDPTGQTLNVAFQSLSNTVTAQGQTMTTQGMSISAIQGQISTKIWTTDITAAVNGIQVGGRNLVKESIIGGTQTTDYYGGTHAYYQAITAAKNWRLNSWTSHDVGYYSLGFWVKASAACTLEVDICDRGNTNFSVTTSWQYFKLENVYADQYLVSPYYGFIDFNPNASVTLYLGNVKLEQGSKATGWSPAPEDVQTQINTANGNISTLQTTVTNNSSSITQLQNSISQKVDSSTYTSYTSTNDSNVTSLTSRMTTAEGEITTQANQISLKVDSGYVQTQINGIQVGGKNIIRNTNPTGTPLPNASTAIGTGVSVAWSVASDTASPNGYVTKLIRTDTAAVQGGAYWAAPYALTSGQQYSWSLWAKGSGTLNIGCEQAGVKSITLTSTYSHYTYTFTADSRSNHQFIFYWLTGAASNEIDFYNLKVEVGNKSTDWSPAPEDVSAAISSAQTTAESYTDAQIQILQNSITLKVSTSDFTTYQSNVSGQFSTTNGNVTTAQTTANNAATAASAAQTTANSKAKTFTSQPSPPYSVGDIWTSTTQETRVCTTARSSGSFTASDWTAASSVTEARMNAAEIKITSDAIVSTVTSSSSWSSLSGTANTASSTASSAATSAAAAQTTANTGVSNAAAAQAAANSAATAASAANQNALNAAGIAGISPELDTQNGSGKWLFRRIQIDNSGNTTSPPTYGSLLGACQSVALVADGTDLVKGTGYTNYIGHLRTNVYVSSAKTFTISYTCDEECSWLVNGVVQATGGTPNASSTGSATLTLAAGWNVIDIIWRQRSGGDGIYSLSNNIGSVVTSLYAPATNTSVSSSITQLASSISLKVDKNGVISEINQTPESIKINASLLNLTGYVTISSLQSGGSTVVDGSRIYTDTLYVKKLYGASNTSSYATVGADGSFTVYSSSQAKTYIQMDISTNGYSELIATGGGSLNLASGNSSVLIGDHIMLTPAGSYVDVSGSLEIYDDEIIDGDATHHGQAQELGGFPNIYGNNSMLQLSWCSYSDTAVSICDNGFRPAATTSGIAAAGSHYPNCTYDLGDSSHRWTTVYAVNALNTSSDSRLKNTIQVLDEDKSLAFIMAVQPSSFIFNSDRKQKTHLGAIAQNVEDALISAGMDPTVMSLVEMGDDGYYSLCYSELIAPMISVIQRQQKDIGDLQNRVAILETRLAGE